MDKFVVIDLETTGHSPANNDRIIEVGIVAVENNEICGEFSSLINPEKPIPPFITNLTGITDEDVRHAPVFHEKAAEIAALFQNSYLVAHNVAFDFSFLNKALEINHIEPLHNPVIDTVELARILYPQAPSFKLSQLAAYLNITHDDPHRALSDAYVTAKLLLKLKEKFNLLPYETITQLIRLEGMLTSDLRDLLVRRQEELAFETNQNNAIITHHGLAFRKFGKQNRASSEIETSFGDYLDGIYEEDGLMEQQMKNYEMRPGQRTMSEDIYDSFQSKNHALIEAETGTGKSLAYLLPAVYEAVKTNKRIIISTYTTQLQTQLLDEEIPFIRELVSFPFAVTLLKGKEHYISLEKFERELESEQPGNYDITLTKAMILVWLTETNTGDIEEIQLPSSGFLFFKRISAQTESYLESSSSWYKYSYYQHVKQQANKADIIITNHALLCTDIFHEYQFLPAYERVIIDEAHHFEDIASKQYGLKLEYAAIHYRLSHIGTTNNGNWLEKIMNKYTSEIDKTAINVKWNPIFEQTNYEADDFFRYIFQYVLEQKKNDKSLSDVGRTQYRFEPDEENTRKWTVMQDMANRLIFHFRDLIYMLAELEQSLTKIEKLEKNDQDEIKTNIDFLQTFIDHVELLFLVSEDGCVKWVEIEANGAKNAVYLYREPIQLDTILTDDFFEKKQSVILTSATLTMNNSFAFIQERLGISSERLIAKKICSPFSYYNQAQLLIPNDFPDVRQDHAEPFIYSTCEAIISLAEVTNGRMLVLFTSYDMLRKSYVLLQETLDTSKYALIAQGISSGSRARLKKNFVHHAHSILLGTSSFWEGVDIPGEDLSCVVIVRLPFQPPNHPVYEAKADRLKQSGKNAFMELALPNAVIKFKQGFGRLIRSSNDRGIVFVCDARIMKARYGNYFTGSIPNVPISYQSTSQLMQTAKDWF